MAEQSVSEPRLAQAVSALGGCESSADVIEVGARLVDAQDHDIDALDAALAIGIEDANQGRLYRADEVFTALRARLG